MQRPINTRPGFTLVEMMMVIIIVGMLVALLGVGVSSAVKATKRAKIKVEISNLDMAMQSYKSNFGGQNPPCMAIPHPTKSVYTPGRDALFNTAWRKRFPRNSGDYATFSDPTSNLNPFNFWYVADLRNANPHDPNPSYPPIKLNLETMDAAESLVFWLAGPPTPVEMAAKPPDALPPPPTPTLDYESNSILYGFSASPTDPLQRTGSRTAALFDFDETRLTDVDGDGWPEYCPPITTSSRSVPPYVYFDASSYQYQSNSVAKPLYVACYPGGGTFLRTPSFPTVALGGSTATLKTQVDRMGFAVPYAESFFSASKSNPPLMYWNAKKYQIICCGLDGEYGGSAMEDSGVVRPNPLFSSVGSDGLPLSVPLVPKTGTAPQDSTPTILPGEWDNLTNFSDATMEDTTPQ